MSELRRRLLYAKPKEVPNYLCFTALESGTFTLRIGQQIGTRFYKYVEYSVDECATWNRTNNVDNTEVIITTPTITAGNKVYWRGSGTYISNYTTVARYSNFTSDGKFDASGNIASLCGLKNFNNWEATTTECQFAYLFANSKIVDADALILPKFNKIRPYHHTFENCIEMTVMPALPDQDVLYSNAYISMFQGCTSLVSAKSLPATTLASGCYSSMFYGCSSLTTPPLLHATVMEADCYLQMFQGCTSLATAPTLNATTLAYSCYRAMFYGCTSIVTAPSLPATTLADRCYQAMFQGCTSLATAPLLPATTLKPYCYYSMFQGCTSLTGTFILPATVATTQCYVNMLRCNPTYIKMLLIDLGSTNALISWLYGVANESSRILVKHIDAVWTTTGSSGVPTNWTVIYYDPAVDKYYTDQTRATECDDHGNPI